MAQGKAELIVKIKATGKKTLEGINKAIDKSKSFAKKAAIGYAALTAAIIKFGQQGSKILDLKNAFRNLAESQGQDAQKMLQSMREASKGTISDMKLMEQANNALLLGLPVERFGDMLKIARSSAKATGQSMEFMLNSITTGIGRGSKLMLDNLGIIIDTNKAYKDFAAANGLAADKLTDFQKKQAFTNAALEIGLENAKKTGDETLSVGEKYTAMKVKIKNATDVIMTLFVPALDEVVKTTTSMVDLFDDMIRSDVMVAIAKVGTKAFTALNVAMEGVTAVFMETFKPVIEAIPALMRGNFSKALQIVKRDTKSFNDIFIEQKQVLTTRLANIDAQFEARRVTLTKASSAKVLAQKKFEAEETARIKSEADIINKEMEVARQEEAKEEKRLFNEQLKDIDNQHQMEMLNQAVLNAQTHQAKMDAIQKKTAFKQSLIRKQEQKEQTAMFKFKQFLGSEEVKNTQSVLGQISGLQNSSNAEMVALGKAAAIANITVSTAVGAMKAWELGPIAGPILAPLVIAAGAVSAAQVAGVQLADGGVVQSRPGGVQATIGEGGQDEAVIPLDDVGGSGGIGSTINITVNGGMLGDEQSAREFAEAVDQRLLELKQDNASVAFEGVI